MFDEAPDSRASRAADVDRESEYAEPARRMTRMPTWQEMLRAAARRRPGRAEPLAESEAPRTEQSLGGCLLRLVLFGVFLFFALISGLFVFGVSLLQMF